MSQPSDEIKARYGQTLNEFLSGSRGESGLMRAYDTGREAYASGLGILDLTSIHHQAMLKTTLGQILEEEAIRLSGLGEEFLAQVLIPYEMSNRGYEETIEELHELNESLEQRVAERSLKVERQLERISSLHQIDVAISSGADLKITLDVLLSETISHLGVDAADVLLFNPNTNLLEFAAGRGFHWKGVKTRHVRLGEGFAGTAALQRQVVQVEDPEALGSNARLSEILIEGDRLAAYYSTPLVAKGHIKGVLEVFHRNHLGPDEEWLDYFETLASQAAIAIDNAQLFENQERTNAELTIAYDTTLEGWSRALDLRDRETEGHCLRVTEMTLLLGRAMNLFDDELVHVRRGALLHDIGKMGVPDAILLKNGALNDDEWQMMRQHPTLALKLLSPIPFLRRAIDIPYSHHEKWDGTGYPRGLAGEQIPFYARLFAPADVWDALRSERPYRAAWSDKKAIAYMEEQAGKHFDPNVMEVFLGILDSAPHEIHGRHRKK